MWLVRDLMQGCTAGCRGLYLPPPALQHFDNGPRYWHVDRVYVMCRRHLAIWPRIVSWPCFRRKKSLVLFLSSGRWHRQRLGVELEVTRLLSSYSNHLWHVNTVVIVCLSRTDRSRSLVILTSDRTFQKIRCYRRIAVTVLRRNAVIIMVCWVLEHGFRHREEWFGLLKVYSKGGRMFGGHPCFQHLINLVSCFLNTTRHVLQFSCRPRWRSG